MCQEASLPMTLQNRNRNGNIDRFNNLSRQQSNTDIQTIMKRKLNNDDAVIITEKKCVRFCPQPLVDINNDLFTKEEIESYWLSPEDFSDIQMGILMTLNIMKMIGGAEAGDEYDNIRCPSLSLLLSSSSSFCSRGIEQYSFDGSLKPSVMMRRHNAILVVLIEQDQDRQEQERATSYDENCMDGNVGVKAGRTNYISEYYQNENYLNTEYGIYIGCLDSQQALEVYQQRFDTANNNNNSNSNNRTKTKTKSSSVSTSSLPLPSLPSKNEQIKVISRAA
jgi:hypothetical protein